MLEELALKRRTVLEKELDDTYYGKLVRIPDGQVVRIQSIGVEWAGRSTYTVIIHGGSRRVIFDYIDFKHKTKILRD